MSIRYRILRAARQQAADSETLVNAHVNCALPMKRPWQGLHNTRLGAVQINFASNGLGWHVGLAGVAGSLLPAAGRPAEVGTGCC